MTKQALIAELLRRPQGVTRREMLDALGWKAISMQADAKQCGLTLRKEKRNGVFVYFGTRRRPAAIVIRQHSEWTKAVG